MHRRSGTRPVECIIFSPMMPASRRTGPLPEVPPEIRAFLDAGDADGVENAFMTRLEEAPDDTDFFIGTLRGLAKKRAGLAETFLELLLETMQGDGQGAVRTDVLQSCLKFWPDCSIARTQLVEQLRAEYRDSPNFDRVAGHCDVVTSGEPLAALESLERWLRYDEGRPVYLPTKGVGRVCEVNLSLDKIRVQFEGDGGKGMSLKIDEAGRLLEPLPRGHFLRDKLENPAELQHLAESDPGEVLRRLFTSVCRPLTTIEMKEMLDGVVDSARWSAWWNRARNDPRLIVGSGARPECRWIDSAEEADAEVGARFDAAPPREQLEMVRKYAARSQELAETMAGRLAASAEKLQASDPALALEIALTLENRLSRASQPAVGSQALLLRDDAAQIISGIADRNMRKKAIVEAQSSRTDWQLLYRRLLVAESDAQCVGHMYDALGEADGAGLDEFVVQTLASPSTAPGFFAWLCKEIASRQDLKKRADYRLIRSVVSALADVSLKDFHAALRALFDPGGAAHIAVGNLQPEEARELLASLDRDMGLESYRREELRRDLLRTYPNISEAKREAFFTTAEALERKREEFRRLVKVELPNNAVEIKRAKEYGDLSENFEYHAARARQELLSSQAKTLEDQLGSARVLDASAVDPSTVNVGTRVRLDPAGDGGEEISLTILGPWDSDPSRNILSYLAPSVGDLLGARVGDTCEFNGRSLRIADITVWTA